MLGSDRIQALDPHPMMFRYLTTAFLLFFIGVSSVWALGIPAPQTLVAEAVTASQARLNGAAIAPPTK